MDQPMKRHGEGATRRRGDLFAINPRVSASPYLRVPSLWLFLKERECGS